MDIVRLVLAANAAAVKLQAHFRGVKGRQIHQAELELYHGARPLIVRWKILLGKMFARSQATNWKAVQRNLIVISHRPEVATVMAALDSKEETVSYHSIVSESRQSRHGTITIETVAGSTDNSAGGAETSFKSVSVNSEPAPQSPPASVVSVIPSEASSRHRFQLRMKPTRRTLPPLAPSGRETPREPSGTTAGTGTLVSTPKEISARNDLIGNSQAQMHNLALPLQKTEMHVPEKNSQEARTQIFSIQSNLTTPSVTTARSFPAMLPSSYKMGAQSFNDLAELDSSNSSRSFSHSRGISRSFVQLSSLAQSQFEMQSFSPPSVIEAADHWHLEAWRQHTKIRRPAARTGCNPRSAKMLLRDRASASSDMVFC